ncbi:MAG: hypothetical protein WCA37_09410 [Terracidiphilus sp.]
MQRVCILFLLTRSDEVVLVLVAGGVYPVAGAAKEGPRVQAAQSIVCPGSAWRTVLFACVKAYGWTTSRGSLTGGKGPKL